MKLGIFTKPIHVEKIVNFLNQKTKIKYVICTSKNEIDMYDFDIGISYCFPYIIDLKGRPWFNYHPAPLKYPGFTNYSKPVKDKVREFGVALHQMTSEVDKGPIVKVRKFKLDSIPINSNELGSIVHYHLFQLFKETIATLETKVNSYFNIVLLDNEQREKIKEVLKKKIKKGKNENTII